MYLILILPIIGRNKGNYLDILPFNIKHNIRISVENSFRSLETERDSKGNDKLTRRRRRRRTRTRRTRSTRKKRKKQSVSPGVLRKHYLNYDLVDIVSTNDYYKKKADFSKHQKEEDRKLYEKELDELTSRAEGKGSIVPFNVAQVCTRFKMQKKLH